MKDLKNEMTVHIGAQNCTECVRIFIRELIWDRGTATQMSILESVLLFRVSAVDGIAEYCQFSLPIVLYSSVVDFFLAFFPGHAALETSAKVRQSFRLSQ